MPVLLLPDVLHDYGCSSEPFVSQATTLGELLDELTTRAPKIAPMLFEGQQLSPFMALSVNGKISSSYDPSLVLAAEDKVALLPAVAGG